MKLPVATILLMAVAITNVHARLVMKQTSFSERGTSSKPLHHPIQSRIVGGQPSAPGAFPFFTTVNSEESLCGASLIHDDFIMTAAHCEGAFDAGVRIGVQDISNRQEGVVGQVVEQFQHPEYDYITVANDIMLLKLSTPVSSIQPVPYVTRNSAPNTGEVLTVIGFGTTSSFGPSSEVLQQVNVDAVSDSICSEQYNGEIDADVMFCAGVPKGGKDSCQGDSGGPILDSSGTQVGIVSFGEGCGLSTHAGVYTRVSAFADWIHATICENSSNPPDSCGNGNTTGAVTLVGSDSTSSQSILGRLEITFDQTPEETSWYIYDLDNSNEVVTSGPEYVAYPREEWTVDFELQAGHSYEFVLEDATGNGFDGSFGIYAVEHGGRKTLLTQGPTSSAFFSDFYPFTAPAEDVRGIH